MRKLIISIMILVTLAIGIVMVQANNYKYLNKTIIEKIDKKIDSIKGNKTKSLILLISKIDKIIKSEKNETKKAIYSELNTYLKLKKKEIGDKVIVDEKKETTLVKSKEVGNYVYYDGIITVSGEYKVNNPETLFGGVLCFFPDNETGYLIPRDPNLYGENNGDDRSAWFCFNDNDKAKEMFGINDKEIFMDKSIDSIQGKATIIISDYTVDKLESSVSDTATLDKVILKEKYTIQ